MSEEAIRLEDVLDEGSRPVHLQASVFDDGRLTIQVEDETPCTLSPRAARALAGLLNHPNIKHYIRPQRIDFVDGSIYCLAARNHDDRRRLNEALQQI